MSTSALGRGDSQDTASVLNDFKNPILGAL